MLVAAALLHDISYAAPIAQTGFHPLVGAVFLRELGYPQRLTRLVAHHSVAVLRPPRTASPTCRSSPPRGRAAGRCPHLRRHALRPGRGTDPPRPPSCRHRPPPPRPPTRRGTPRAGRGQPGGGRSRGPRDRSTKQAPGGRAGPRHSGSAGPSPAAARHCGGPVRGPQDPSSPVRPACSDRPAPGGVRRLVALRVPVRTGPAALPARHRGSCDSAAAGPAPGPRRRAPRPVLQSCRGLNAGCAGPFPAPGAQVVAPEPRVTGVASWACT